MLITFVSMHWPVVFELSHSLSSNGPQRTQSTGRGSLPPNQGQQGQHLSNPKLQQQNQQGQVIVNANFLSNPQSIASLTS
jgi:hypothetical protein